MRMNAIPGTDITVSAVCLGTMTFGSPVGEYDAIRLIHYALDKGINSIDTANMYEGYARVPGSSGGVAEEILGKAISGRRDEVVVATKLGMKVGEAPEDEGTSAAAIRKHLDASLKRLKTDYIDIYYLHKPDPESSLVETLIALQDATQAGKIRCYGVSNHSAEQTAELLQEADNAGLPRPVFHQTPLSLLKQDFLVDLLPLCERKGIAVVPYQILQGGLLTGKYRRGMPFPSDSRKAEKEGWVWELTDELFGRLEDIESQAAQSGLSMTQYAIKWTLEQKAVVSAIIGVKSTDQIDLALSAC